MCWSNSHFWCEFQKSKFTQSKLQLLHIQTCLAEADLQLGLAPDTWGGQCDHPDLADGGVRSGALQREADHGSAGGYDKHHCVSSGFAQCVSCLKLSWAVWMLHSGVVVINLWDRNVKQFSSLTFAISSVFKHIFFNYQHLSQLNCLNWFNGSNLVMVSIDSIASIDAFNDLLVLGMAQRVAKEHANPDSEPFWRRDRCGLDRGGLRAEPGEGQKPLEGGVARGWHQISACQIHTAYPSTRSTTSPGNWAHCHSTNWVKVNCVNFVIFCHWRQNPGCQGHASFKTYQASSQAKGEGASEGGKATGRGSRLHCWWWRDWGRRRQERGGHCAPRSWACGWAPGHDPSAEEGQDTFVSIDKALCWPYWMTCCMVPVE